MPLARTSLHTNRAKPGRDADLDVGNHPANAMPGGIHKAVSDKLTRLVTGRESATFSRDKFVAGCGNADPVHGRISPTSGDDRRVFEQPERLRLATGDDLVTVSALRLERLNIRKGATPGHNHAPAYRGTDRVVRMTGPASSTLAALSATVRLLAAGAGAWLPLLLILGWLSAVPEAVGQRFLPDVLRYVVTPYGLDENLLLGVALGAMIVVLLQLIVRLIALVLVFIVIADLAAGRPVDIRAGLRRTLAWRLQFSWLLSSVIFSAATGLWFIGGCIIFLPYGLAIADAYETDSGLAAFGRSSRLGTMRVGGPGSAQPGWSLAGASTVLMLGFFVATGTLAIVGSIVSPSLDLGALGTALMGADPTRPERLILEVLPTLIPTPTWLQTVWSVLQGPIPVLREVVVLTVGLVVYQHAIAAEAERRAAGDVAGTDAPTG